MSGNIIQPGWTAFYARQHQTRKQADTFDVDMARLRELGAEMLAQPAHEISTLPLRLWVEETLILELTDEQCTSVLNVPWPDHAALLLQAWREQQQQDAA